MTIEQPTPVSQPSPRTLCLTPECQKLWAIRPGLCFLYDDVIIDSQDYDEILEAKDDSTYNVVLARNVERLRMEGILHIQPFRPLISPDIRRKVHTKANEYIEAIPLPRRVELASFGHKEYEEYLKAQILFCRSDEWKFTKLTERLRKVGERIAFMKCENRTTPEIDEAMKRVVAKTLAGAYIASHFAGSHFYDTSEYRPFVTALPIDEEFLNRPEVKRYDDTEDTAFDIVAAVVLNKNLPDVTVYDDHSLTTFMRTREELLRLRSLIQEVLERYRDLIAVDPETAREHLHQRFTKAREVVDQELQRIKNRSGLLWKVTEILATIKYAIVKPFLKPLFDTNIRIHRQRQIAKLARQDNLLADLFFVFDEVRFGEQRYPIETQRTFRQPKESDNSLWGQGENPLPWYEQC